MAISKAAFPFLLVVLTCSPLLASWAYVPQEVRVAEADLVVAGEVQALGDVFVKGGREYRTGLIKPIKLLKGTPDPKIGIHLAWPEPNPNGLRLSTDLPAPRVGDKSVWVMRADEKMPVYWATYPTDRQPIAKLKEMEKRVAALKKLTWSKPQDGLRIGLFTEQRDMRKSQVRIKGKPVKAVAQISVYALLHNTSKQTMHVSNYIFDKPFDIEFSGPDGKPIEVKLYGPPRPKKPAPTKYNFLEVPPQQIRHAGYGFTLPMLTEGGEYTIRLSHSNSLDPAALKLANVWRGELAAPAVRVNVPK